MSTQQIKDTIKVGDRYGDWTVLDNNCNHWKVKCRCACGKETHVNIYNLASNGKSLRCTDCARKMAYKGGGISKTRTYKMWHRNRDSLCEKWQDYKEWYKVFGDLEEGYVYPMRYDLPTGPDNYVIEKKRRCNGTGKGPYTVKGATGRTLQDVAKQLGMSKQRVHQILQQERKLQSAERKMSKS